MLTPHSHVILPEDQPIEFGYRETCPPPFRMMPAGLKSVCAPPSLGLSPPLLLVVDWTPLLLPRVLSYFHLFLPVSDRTRLPVVLLVSWELHPFLTQLDLPQLCLPPEGRVGAEAYINS